ncbi:MAG: tetratricopeptide repeat protein [Pseudomonadota bacterium]
MNTEPLDRIMRNVTVGFVLLLSAGLLHASPGTDAFEAGNYEQAETLLTAELERADDPQKTLLLGRVAFETGRFDTAFDHFKVAVKALPDDAEAQYWYGSAAGTLAGNVSMFRAAGYAKKSRRALQRALELDPRHVGAHEAMAQYLLQAPGFMGGDKDEALALAEKLSGFAPVEGHLLLAAIYRQTNRGDQAQATLAELTKRLPDEPRGWLQLGFAHQGDENYADAHVAFARAAELGAEAGDVASELGALYQVARTAVFSESRVDDGIAAMERFIATRPADDASLPGVDWAHFRLGQLLTKRGDTKAANEAFETAIAITEDDNLPTAVRRFRRST